MLINGQPADQIPITDRGLLYGDGLFETMAVIDSNPHLWQRHMQRLSRGEAVLGLPSSDKEQLRREAEGLCRGCARGVLKLILTRGSGGRGYRPPLKAEPRRIFSLHPWPDYTEVWQRDGIRLRLCETRWSRNRRLAGIKHLNRLEQVLARQEWRDPAIGEGLMLDEQGRVISVTQGNIFLVDDDGLHTPDLTHAGIAGVLRGLVIECAQRLEIPVAVAPIDLDRVKSADALFVTNALLGVCPVVALDDLCFEPREIPADLRRVVSERMAH